ncbi:MAG: hypothetical protein UEP57_00735 [Oscillospiraceae bacterium]|nr:hypothetical protein [Oscillospiraceae bacterium]
MNQTVLAAVCRTIVGPTGRRLSAYPGIFYAYTQGLFADYYRTYGTVSDKTLYRYANRDFRFPHFIAQHYRGERGYRRTLGDMMGIADSTGILMLRSIQDDLHKCVAENLPAEDAQVLSRNYVNQNATRNQIAVYLADVMHYAIHAADV